MQHHLTKSLKLMIVMTVTQMKGVGFIQKQREKQS